MQSWVWRSLVACLNGVQEAGGSNPLTQTKKADFVRFLFFLDTFKLTIHRRFCLKCISSETLETHKSFLALQHLLQSLYYYRQQRQDFPEIIKRHKPYALCCAQAGLFA